MEEDILKAPLDPKLGRILFLWQNFLWALAMYNKDDKSGCLAGCLRFCYGIICLAGAAGVLGVFPGMKPWLLESSGT